MNISKIYTNNNVIISILRQNRVTEKIYKWSKYAFSYLFNHRYEAAFSCCSYLFIESMVTVSASTAMTDTDYVYNLESCRQKLCEFSNNYTERSGHYLPAYDVTCNISLQDMPYYSFSDCMDDLCRYTSRIGEKFYACTGEFLINNSVSQYSYLNENKSALEYWNQVCPKRHFTHLTKLKQLKYLTRCIEKMCKLNDTVSTFGREVLELCKNSPLEKLDEVLHEIFRSINKLKNNLDESSSLTTTSIITSIAASVTGVVSGIATIVGVIITHRACTPRSLSTDSYLSSSPSPTLARSIASIAHSGTQSTLSMLTETLNQIQDLLPSAMVNSLQGITDYVDRSTGEIQQIIELIELGI